MSLPPRIHRFKCWPEPFEAMQDGLKTHEVRKDDRVDRPTVGDVVVLRQWDPETENYTGHEFSRRVTHVTEPGTFGLPPDLYVMSLRALTDPT